MGENLPAIRGGNYKIISIPAFPSEKCQKKNTCPALFLPVLDKQTDSDLKNFSLSFGKVSKVFTLPALFLPVLDRQTACNFHPCHHIL